MISMWVGFMVQREIVNRYYLLPRWLIFSVKMIDIISTKVTLRILEYFFYKPVKFNVPQREREFISKSAISTMSISRLAADVEIYRMEAEGEKVLLVHGWNGRAGQFHAIAQSCHDAGLDVTALDLPGHGKSDDRHTALPEFVDAISEIYAHHGPFDHVIGHSIGAIAVLNGPRFGLTFRKIVTISIPATKVRSLFQSFTEMFGLSVEKYTDLLIERASKKYNADPNSFDPCIVSKDLDSEVLIIHCRDDEDAGVSESIQLNTMVDGSELYIASGLGHRRILRDAEVVSRVVDFLRA
tara:strand:- start:52391 stop:53281 length:891 start_codon:yes stop_codon:yes gene_type:complete